MAQGENMTEKIIIAAISYAVYIAIWISIPIRSKKMMADSGAKVMDLKVASSKRWILIMAVCAVIIGLIFIRNLGTFMNVIVCLCALLAAWMSANAGSSYKYDGVYENMIVAGSNHIRYDNIDMLPTLSYENDPETIGVSKITLKVSVKKGSDMTLLFFDQEERDAAVAKILELVTRLKP
jgi:hypothetical protein